MTQTLDDSRMQRGKKQKRRRNLFMNVLIVIVLFVAVTVTIQLFTSHSKEVAKSKTVNQKKATNDSAKKADSPAVSNNNDANKGDSQTSQTKPAEDKKVEVPDQKDSSVTEAYTKPAWSPVKTSQTGSHTTQFDSSSQDWKEMVQTISYAVNIPSDNLTILFIGNNGPNKAIGTVQTKDTKERYKVYIEWVDNQGWKPTLVKHMK